MLFFFLRICVSIKMTPQKVRNRFKFNQFISRFCLFSWHYVVNVKVRLTSMVRQRPIILNYLMCSLAYSLKFSVHVFFLFITTHRKSVQNVFLWLSKKRLNLVLEIYSSNNVLSNHQTYHYVLFL